MFFRDSLESTPRCQQSRSCYDWCFLFWRWCSCFGWSCLNWGISWLRSALPLSTGTFDWACGSQIDNCFQLQCSYRFAPWSLRLFCRIFLELRLGSLTIFEGVIWYPLISYQDFHLALIFACPSDEAACLACRSRVRTRSLCQWQHWEKPSKQLSCWCINKMIPPCFWSGY